MSLRPHGSRIVGRRALCGCVAALLVVPGAAFALGRESAPAVPVAIGDIVKVNGAPLGCVIRFQNGLRAVDCRKTGPLAGTYGTILTKTQVLVVRYENRRSGRIVYSAHHHGVRAKVCG